METLPNEMLELIVWKLSPRDLAHCSAVCRSWYKTLNQDWIWAPYCDPELEEPLQTIPSVATPTFEIPEAGTLPPISRWKRAFMREKHLWMNWRPEKIKQFKEENIVAFEHKNCLDVDFFSDTSIVAWYSDKIEILDISVMPAVIAAKTGTSVKIDMCDKVSVVGIDMLLVGNSHSISVFNVDIENKSITLKYHLDNASFHKVQIAKENIYFFDYDEGEKMKILDLNTGKILKEEITIPEEITVPEEMNQNIIIFVKSIICSTTSDFVVVELASNSPDANEFEDYNIFVYSLKQLKYLPSPKIKAWRRFGQILLHDHWIAHQQHWREGHKVTIYNISLTEGVVFSDEIIRYALHGAICNGCFVITSDHVLRGYSYVGIYSPSGKTLTAIDVKSVYHFEVIKNKFITLQSKRLSHVHGRRHVVSETVLLRVLNQKVEKCDFSIGFNDVRKINKSFTKVINERSSDYKTVWYISHFWSIFVLRSSRG